MVVPTVWLIAISTRAKYYGIEWVMDLGTQQLLHATTCLLTYVTSLPIIFPALTRGAKHKSSGAGNLFGATQLQDL